MRRALRALVVGASMMVSLGLAHGQQSTNGMLLAFHIEAQPMEAALTEFGTTTGLQVLFKTQLTREQTAPAVIGELTPEAALQKLLSGSSLRYEWVNHRTVAIREMRANEGVGARKISYTAEAAPMTLAEAEDGASNNGATMSTGVGADSSRKASSDKVSLTEVVVTGTSIRGAVPPGSPLRTYTRKEIDRSGAATVDQFARQMFENFSNVDPVANSNSNVTAARLNGSSISNLFAGASFNLRGLGATSTLTLLNGHRLSPAGSNGSLVDMSLVPLSAVDHIEVLPDGASAIYGADAVAGVVNMITRKEFSGAETSVRYGGASDGGAIEMTGTQLLGTSWKSGNAFLNYEYDRQNGLKASQRDYIPDQGGSSYLLPENRRNSVFVSGSQEIGRRAKILGNVGFSRRDFLNVNNLRGSTISQNVSSEGVVKQPSAALALDIMMGGDWRLSFSGDVSTLRQDSSAATTTVIGNLTIPASSTRYTRSDAIGTDILADGSIVSLPGGTMRAALGAGYRTEKFESQTANTSAGGTSSSIVPELQRHVASTFAEIFVPVVGPQNAVPGARRVELSVAARYDRYSDFGSTSNPKFGLVWELVSGVRLRSTYGKSFRAPLLSDVGLPPQYSTTLARDASGFTDTLFISGGNNGLDPETAKSFTAGIDASLERFPQLSFELTYFRVDFDKRISRPPRTGATPISDPILAPFLKRNPTLAEVQAYFSDPNFLVDAARAGAAGVKAIFDDRVANIATTLESGVDLSTRYELSTAFGNFDVGVSATRLIKNDFRTVETASPFPLLNTFGQPPKWRGRANAGWTRGGLSASLSVNHVNSYDNTLFTPSPEIDSWTTADLYLSYRTGESGNFGALRGVTIALSALNLANKEPPYVHIPALLPGQSPAPYDPANASPVGRTVSLLLTKRW